MSAPLELFAMRWLRWEKKCVIAICERSPRYGVGEPDCLGITPARYLIEIEVKRSVSDFRADARKHSKINRVAYIKQAPKQFYYLVACGIVEKVKPIVPEWAGLMRGPTPNDWNLRVEKVAPINQESKKLSIKECSSLVKCVGNYAMSQMETTYQAFSNYACGSWPHPEPEYEI